MPHYGIVTSCSVCAQSRLALSRRTTPLKLFPAKEPLTEVAIDILGPLVRTTQGNRFTLVMTDRFSKLVRCIPLHRITVLSVASGFIGTWVTAYGPPDSLLSDQVTQFMSKLSHAVLRTLGIEPKCTTPYHPQNNSW